MIEFECSRESPEKLWVKTPYPVTHAVWDFFVLKNFPPFDTSMHSAEMLKHHGQRWINRPRSDLAEIADGEHQHYWTHAYLPDDERRGVAKAEWGLVNVASNQTTYLDTLEYSLTAPDKDLANTKEGGLSFLTGTEKIAVLKAFQCYSKSAIPQSTPTELKRRLCENMTQTFSFEDRVNRGIGMRIVARGYDNTFEKLVAVEFLENVDEALNKYSSNTGTRSLKDSEIIGMNADLYSEYHRILDGK